MAIATAESKRLELAKRLVSQLQAGDSAGADDTIGQLAGYGEHHLFQEVGRLTRDLHDALKSFLLDARISELAEREIHDAGERLGYVITMTENAANTSLGAVEASLPLADELGSQAKALAADWRRFQERELSVEEFRLLSRELELFLQTAGSHSGLLHGKLSEVLMAQDFQDLTGQIIRRVISLIQDVEYKLVRLVRISGGLDGRAGARRGPGLEAPSIPGMDQVNDQDDVDDLLSSLGF